jgi:hypothetical protein
MKKLAYILLTSFALIFTSYAAEPIKSPNGMKLAKKKDHSKDKKAKKPEKPAKKEQKEQKSK